MTYTNCIPYFDEIARRGIPIRDPKMVVVWARKRLWEAMSAFGAEWLGTVAGTLRSPYMSDATWNSYIESGSVHCIIDRDYCKRLWNELDYPHPTPSFTGSPTDMDILSSFEGERSFAGKIYDLLKKRQRLLGLCGSWLRSYRDGRLYYGSLHPFACSTGRCAPCPSDGFLPGMGREVTKALLNPPKGREISILDYKAQGLCILAALSHDPVMTALARAKKDPYLGLGKILKRIPDADYTGLSVEDLKAKYSVERDRLKKFMMAYQYGAGAERLGGIIRSRYDIKKGMDSLFSVYSEWLSHTTADCTLPDGYHSTAKTASVAWVQGYDSYILRRIVTEINLPDSAFIIATNHDCIWVEHNAGFDISPFAKQMETIADDVCQSPGLFRVDVETIAHS